MASLVEKSLAWLRAPTNSLSLGVRQVLRWRRGCPILVNEEKEELFDYADEAERAACERRHGELLRKYHLDELREQSSRLDYRENLYLLDNLEGLLGGMQPQTEGRPLRAVDVGSKSWSYVFALERFLRYWDGEREVELLGIEVDGYGINRDLYSRCDHASAHQAQTGNAKVDYWVGDFLDLDLDLDPGDSGVDVVTLFYPFLTRYALLKWGLPLKYFQPEKIIQKALVILNRDGWLVVFNQAERERRILMGILYECGARIRGCRPLRSRMVHYQDRVVDRWGVVATKS